MARAIYLGIFVVLSVVAGALYYAGTREVSVVIAHGDLRVGTRVGEGSMVTIRAHPGDVPAGAARDLSEVLGSYVAWPVLDGQFIPRRALARNRASLIGGLDVPAGYHAFSIPVTAVEAVGGELRPGDLVDILAVARNQAPGASPAPATILGKGVLILGVRNEQGQALDSAGSGGVRGLNFSTNRVASVVIAVPPDDEARYAAAAAVSVFSVALNLE